MGKASITLDDIYAARRTIQNSSLGVVKTPLIPDCSKMFPRIDIKLNLYLKLENTQTTGSFKIRGVANQMANLPQEVQKGEKKLITMSAGNYGKAFAYALRLLNLPGLCLMPETAPANRVELIKEHGIEVEQYPTSILQQEVDKRVENDGFLFLHSFDDPTLIAGYGSAALEVLEEGVQPDVVIVCCGGGGLVSGLAATFKLKGLKDCRIYAVEPQGSCTMYESFKQGHAVTIPTVKSVAAGLSPPYAGKNTYSLCKEYVEDILLVSDEEMLNTMAILYSRGLVVEPSGCAAMAALLHGHVPNVENKKVLVFLTGGNVSPQDMSRHIGNTYT